MMFRQRFYFSVALVMMACTEFVEAFSRELAFYVGEGNHPAGYAFFYQFGISSAYPIKGNWSVFVQCPNIGLNQTRECIPSARYINGSHSFWKVLYTFGETYQGMAYSYLGNDSVVFYYSGKSPSDRSLIW